MAAGPDRETFSWRAFVARSNEKRRTPFGTFALDPSGPLAFLEPVEPERYCRNSEPVDRR